jgi:hypothetical protein
MGEGGREMEEDKAKLKHGNSTTILNTIPCQKKIHTLTKNWHQFQ